jgi:hypothetical protein
MSNKAIDAISKQSELITGMYFEDINNIDECRVCAIGALIREMPGDVDTSELSENCYGNGIIIQALHKTINNLCDYYNLTQTQLIALQDLNDCDPDISGTKRLETILDYLKDRNFIELGPNV